MGTWCWYRYRCWGDGVTSPIKKYSMWTNRGFLVKNDNWMYPAITHVFKGRKRLKSALSLHGVWRAWRPLFLSSEGQSLLPEGLYPVFFVGGCCFEAVFFARSQGLQVQLYPILSCLLPLGHSAEIARTVQQKIFASLIHSAVQTLSTCWSVVLPTITLSMKHAAGTKQSKEAYKPREYNI